jgi:hypothetical protein
MPPCIKPHFPPVTSHTLFSPKCVLELPDFAYRMMFLPEGPLLTGAPRAPAPLWPLSQVDSSGAALHPPLLTPTPGVVNAGNMSNQHSHVLRPKGKFNHPSNSYSLLKYCTEELQCDSEKLLQVQVNDGCLQDEHLC